MLFGEKLLFFPMYIGLDAVNRYNQIRYRYTGKGYP